jgi:hypothetical protein
MLPCLPEAAMMRVLEGNPCATERKLRLYPCACVAWAIAHSPKRADFQRIIATAERLAEGVAEPDEVKRCFDEGIASELTGDVGAYPTAALLDAFQDSAYRGTSGFVHDLERDAELTQTRFDSQPYADLLRCIFGIPYRGYKVGFRPFVFDLAWRTDTAIALARQMYDSREFGAMPILADALQDAGCEDEQVLSHCRDAGPHARGCWVVDGVLGLA